MSRNTQYSHDGIRDRMEGQMVFYPYRPHNAAESALQVQTQITLVDVQLKEYSLLNIHVAFDPHLVPRLPVSPSPTEPLPSSTFIADIDQY